MTFLTPPPDKMLPELLPYYTTQGGLDYIGLLRRYSSGVRIGG